MIQQVAQGWQRSLDTGVISDDTRVVDRYIEVDATENAFAADCDIFNRLLVKHLCLLRIPAAYLPAM